MKKSILHASAAWQAIALLGAGVGTAFIAAAPAAAQDYTRGSVQGTVKDAKGAPIAGVTVALTSNEQGFTRSGSTSSSGAFEFTLLPTGSYTLTAKDAAGNVVVNDPAVSVSAGGTANYQYTAADASATTSGGTAAAGDGEIVVTGRRVQTNDFGANTTGLTIDVQKLVESVPVARTQSGLILLAPGTNAGDTGFADCADCVSFGGATIAENSYYVNGLNTTNFRTFVGNNLVPFEFYRTFDVKTGGWSAEYGRALGGVTSAVTKSGSNRFETGAVITYSPDFLQSDSPNTFQDTAGRLKQRNDADYRENVTANFYVSGPIIKDRLFAYALVSPRYAKSADTSVSGGFRFENLSKTPFFGAKIDAIPIDGHRIEGTFWSDKRTITTDYIPVDQLGNATGGSAGREVNKIGGNNYILQYTGQFAKWFTLSGLYGVNNYNRIDVSDGTVPIIQSTLNGGAVQTTSASGIPLAPSAGKDKRTVYRADADVYVSFLGSHHFRGGYDREDLESGENTFYTGGRIFRFTPAYIRARTYLNTGSFKSRQTAFYLQDSWDLLDDRVNLQLGVRNDSYENSGVTGSTYLKIKNQWAPRLGASFDVFGDKLTKLQASFGRYYIGVPTNTNIRLAGAETFYEQRFQYLPGVNRTTPSSSGIPAGQQFDATGAPLFGPVTTTSTAPCPNVGPGAGQLCRTIFSDGIAGPTDTLVAANLKPMYQDEIIVGATHKMDDFTFGLRYTHRKLKQTLEDVAIDAAVLDYCDAKGIAGCSSVFTGFHQYVLANPGSDITVRLDGDCSVAGQCDVVTLTAADLRYPKASRKYDAVEFLIDKAFNGTYGFNFSYTWQKVRGNYEGSVKSDNNQDDAGLTQDFDQPGLVDGANGILANERRHTFKMYGQYRPIEWLTLGASALVASGRNFSCIGVHPTDVFAQAYQAASFYCRNPLGNGGSTNSVLVPRGSAFKGKWTTNLDLGAQFNLPASLGRSSIRVDVFNVFNSNRPNDFIEFGENDNGAIRPDYRLASGYQSPRSVRLTLALRFGGK